MALHNGRGGAVLQSASEARDETADGYTLPPLASKQPSLPAVAAAREIIERSHDPAVFALDGRVQQVLMGSRGQPLPGSRTKSSKGSLNGLAKRGGAAGLTLPRSISAASLEDPKARALLEGAHPGGGMELPDMSAWNASGRAYGSELKATKSVPLLLPGGKIALV